MTKLRQFGLIPQTLAEFLSSFVDFFVHLSYCILLNVTDLSVMSGIGAKNDFFANQHS